MRPVSGTTKRCETIRKEEERGEKGHSELTVQGVPPKTIQSVLGWDQASMMDRYSHFVDEMRMEAAAQMDAILKPVAVNLAVKTAEAKPH